MRRACGVGIVLLLATQAVWTPAAGQQSGGVRAKFRLEPNGQEPCRPPTHIQFELDEELFANGDGVLVTLRVRDLLGRVVAIPTAVEHPEGEQAVERLAYTEPGVKQAYWDGTDRNGKRVAPTVYLLELVVNGERASPIRMVVAK